MISNGILLFLFDRVIFGIILLLQSEFFVFRRIYENSIIGTWMQNKKDQKKQKNDITGVGGQNGTYGRFAVKNRKFPNDSFSAGSFADLQRIGN